MFIFLSKSIYVMQDFEALSKLYKLLHYLDFWPWSIMNGYKLHVHSSKILVQSIKLGVSYFPLLFLLLISLQEVEIQR